jgi:hypothetical protein
MNIQLKYLALIILVALAVGAALTRAYAPREVVKTVAVDHDVVKDHIVTVTKEIVQKDGTKEFDTVVTDDRKEDDTKKTTITDTKTLPSLAPKWFVTAGMGLDASSLSSLTTPVYQIGVNRRILGPIFIGVNANTRSQVGVNVGLEF